MSEDGHEGRGVDFNLPDEVLAVIPTDPYEQLDLARKITSMAISSRVSKLEMEAGRLRQRVSEKDCLIEVLEARVELEKLARENDSRLRTAIDENAKLARERDMLAASSRKMSRDLTKLETFKKQLMQSLCEENSPHPPASVDIGTCEQSSLGLLYGKVFLTLYDEPVGYNSNLVGPVEAAPSTAVQSYWPTPYITPRFTPTISPKVASTSTSPHRYSAAGSPSTKSGATSPAKARIAGTTSPTNPRVSASPAKSHIDAKSALSPLYPTSIRSSTANSPPRSHSSQGRSARIDGKEFFRQARSRLTYEQFAAFLVSIKELNAHRLSRDETLKKSEEIFGPENRDLYLSFHGLLNRNAP